MLGSMLSPERQRSRTPSAPSPSSRLLFSRSVALSSSHESPKRRRPTRSITSLLAGLTLSPDRTERQRTPLLELDSPLCLPVYDSFDLQPSRLCFTSSDDALDVPQTAAAVNALLSQQFELENDAKEADAILSDASTESESSTSTIPAPIMASEMVLSSSTSSSESQSPSRRMHATTTAAACCTLPLVTRKRPRVTTSQVTYHTCDELKSQLIESLLMKAGERMALAGLSADLCHFMALFVVGDNLCCGNCSQQFLRHMCRVVEGRTKAQQCAKRRRRMRQRMRHLRQVAAFRNTNDRSDDSDDEFFQNDAMHGAIAERRRRRRRRNGRRQGRGRRAHKSKPNSVRSNECLLDIASEADAKQLLANDFEELRPLKSASDSLSSNSSQIHAATETALCISSCSPLASSSPQSLSALKSSGRKRESEGSSEAYDFAMFERYAEQFWKPTGASPTCASAPGTCSSAPSSESETSASSSSVSSSGSAPRNGSSAEDECRQCGLWLCRDCNTTNGRNKTRTVICNCLHCSARICATVGEDKRYALRSEAAQSECARECCAAQTKMDGYDGNAVIAICEQCLETHWWFPQ